MADVYKAGGILIQNRKLLVVKSENEEMYFAPGGKIEKNETPKQSLVRELKEELAVEVDENDLEEFGTFYGIPAGQVDKVIEMSVFLVKNWKGTVVASSEIEKILWINSDLPENIKIGSIFAHKVLPLLKNQNLID
jgi:mutator protein MutT